MAASSPCDLAIVGGGLAGSLIALAMRAKRPEVRMLLIDGGDTLGGNHLWSFFDADVAREHRWLLEKLVVHAWPGYDIRFPAVTRTINQPYYSITSERLDAIVRATLSPEEMKNHELIAQLEMQQQLAIKQQERYTHGWSDPTAMHGKPIYAPHQWAPIAWMEEEVKVRQFPKPKLHHVLILAAIGLLALSLFLKATL